MRHIRTARFRISRFAAGNELSGVLILAGKGYTSRPRFGTYVSAGDAKASANLGHLLLAGSPELPADTAEALRLLDYAAGRRSPSALRELADYFEGNPGDSASAGAIKKVADAYSHGNILRYDYKKSIIYYDRAAHLGDTVAKRIVSELIEIFPDALRSEHSQ